MAFAQFQFGQAPQPRLPQTELQIAQHTLKVELATTPEQRQLGLMQRPALGKDEGMLFIFPDAGVQCFWMRNTLIPLTAAFIEDDGTIVNLEDMKPLRDDSHCSKKPVRYVLEMTQGWFKQKGIRAGQKLMGLPK
jgi:uncharacterized membrane protein (UPF0127 family)